MSYSLTLFRWYLEIVSDPRDLTEKVVRFHRLDGDGVRSHRPELGPNPEH